MLVRELTSSLTQLNDAKRKMMLLITTITLSFYTFNAQIPTYTHSFSMDSFTYYVCPCIFHTGNVEHNEWKHTHTEPSTSDQIAKNNECISTMKLYIGITLVAIPSCYTLPLIQTEKANIVFHSGALSIFTLLQEKMIKIYPLIDSNSIMANRHTQ